MLTPFVTMAGQMKAAQIVEVGDVIDAVGKVPLTLDAVR